MTTSQLRVAVTGASGYVGSRIAEYLRRNSLLVDEMNRRTSSGRSTEFLLGASVTPATLSNVDILVHCAYDFSATTWEEIKRINVDGSLRLFAAAQAAGVRRVIFISTLSAFEGCVSLYGRAKLMVEEEASRSGVIVIRPGLVHDKVGAGGMVGALSKLAAAAPIIPMVGNGKHVLYACQSEDLARLVHTLCTSEHMITGPISAACRKRWFFSDLLRAIAVSKGRKPLFIPIPATLVVAALHVVEFLGINMRLRSDSLISLLNQNPAVDFSQLEALGVSFGDFQFQ